MRKPRVSERKIGPMGLTRRRDPEGGSRGKDAKVPASPRTGSLMLGPYVAKIVTDDN